MESWKITLDRFLSSLISPAATWRCSTGFCLKGKKWQSGSTRRERESKNLANPPLSKIFDKNIRLGEDFIKQFKLKSGISYQYICEWFDYIYFLCLIPIQKLEIKIQFFFKNTFSISHRLRRKVGQRAAFRLIYLQTTCPPPPLYLTLFISRFTTPQRVPIYCERAKTHL